MKKAGEYQSIGTKIVLELKMLAPQIIVLKSQNGTQKFAQTEHGDII